MKASKEWIFPSATERKLMGILWIFLMLFSLTARTQDIPDNPDEGAKKLAEDFKFSGNFTLGTNGIAIIPAFALRRPGVSSFLHLRKGRFIYRPQFGFGIEGFPWFFNNCFVYESVKTEKFTLGTGVVWGVGFKHPDIIHNGVLQQAAVGERFLWLELTPEYRFKKNLYINSRVWYGFNFEDGSADRVIFTSATLNINKIRMSEKLFINLQPQFFYLGLDYEQHGFFMFSTAALGMYKLPLLLITQINTPILNSIEPSPVTLWNFGLTFEF
ncbi:MAG: hypothetical protein JJU28_10470 [Cyclobacteriaceae bacterium]|nr:hypothetical protein [Cyclobacteriaceae bacterium]